MSVNLIHNVASSIRSVRDVSYVGYCISPELHCGRIVQIYLTVSHS